MGSRCLQVPPPRRAHHPDSSQLPACTARTENPLCRSRLPHPGGRVSKCVLGGEQGAGKKPKEARSAVLTALHMSLCPQQCRHGSARKARGCRVSQARPRTEGELGGASGPPRGANSEDALSSDTSNCLIFCAPTAGNCRQDAACLPCRAHSSAALGGGVCCRDGVCERY